VNCDPAAQLSGFSDHALPRQPVCRLARLQRRGRNARAARDARELGDLSVRSDAPLRNLADDGMNPAIQLAYVVGLVHEALS
jgi:hypothetical protein